MKGIVIYDTTYGNTKKIAETIAETLKESGIEVDLFDVEKVEKLSARDYDFLVLGSPTRMSSMSRAVKGFIGRLKSDEWVNKPFIAFDTELADVIEKKGASAAEKIAERLREKRLNQILPVLKTAVLGIKGPLKENEIERTKEYSRELIAKLKRLKKTKAVSSSELM